MSKYDEYEFYNLVYAFTVVEGTILRKNASKEEKKIETRKNNIIEAYNDIIKYCKPIFESKETEKREYVRRKLVNIRDRLNHCLGVLNKRIKVPTDFVTEVSTEEIEKPNADQKKEDKNSKMPNDPFTYLSHVSKIINTNYKGDPNALNAFITAIELAESVTPNEHKESLIKFIKTKLEGNALDAIKNITVNNTTDIITALKNKIKIETSKVVLGRLLALRAERHSLQKFQEQADELANALRRAYISEGMTPELAENTTIDKTVEMCRLSAKTPLVKSVLASTHFNDPKEVLAKLITESNYENNETQILYYTRNNMRGRDGRQSNYQNNQYRNNSRGNNRNGRGYYNNFNNRNNYSNGNHNSSNYRGRGRNYSNNFNRRGNNQNRRGNDRYVRMIESENNETPTSQRGPETVTIQERTA